MKLCSNAHKLLKFTVCLHAYIHTYTCVYSIKLNGEDGDVLLDYSKNIITERTMKLLFDLVRMMIIVTIALLF